ncbi:MAG: hypothetical protein WCW13_05060 [archaeon]|jgi:hypothetical protein
MSLYGPKIHLPKVELPSPANPSWGMEKEKKIFVFGVLAIIIIVLLVMFLPPLTQGVADFFSNSINPAVQLSWNNVPLDKTKSIDRAEMSISFTNKDTATKDILYNFNYDREILYEMCVGALYDANQNAYIIQNVSQNEKRVLKCSFNTRPDKTVLTGSYTIEVASNIGNVKTTLEVITPSSK